MSDGARRTTSLCFLLWEAESHYDFQHIQMHPPSDKHKHLIAKWNMHMPEARAKLAKDGLSWVLEDGQVGAIVYYSIAYLCLFVFGKLWLEDP